MNQCSRILPSVLPAVKRIIAIGDIHGDFRALLHCLRLAKCIDKKRKWIGENTVIIQLGDQIDSRCRSKECEKDEIGDEIKIMKFLDELHIEAQKSGGSVYSLLGNHELMNVMGNLNYASAENILSFGDSSSRKNRFAPSGDLAIYLACNRNSIMKVGDFLFVHGGLLPKKARQYTLERMNEIVREYLLGNISESNREVSDLLKERDSPFWSRTFSDVFTGNNSESCSKLDETVEYLKLKGMVVGHTVQRNGINSGCNNKIWRTDIGLSRSFGKKKRRVQVLEILDNGKEINIID